MIPMASTQQGVFMPANDIPGIFDAIIRTRMDAVRRQRVLAATFWTLAVAVEIAGAAQTLLAFLLSSVDFGRDTQRALLITMGFAAFASTVVSAVLAAGRVDSRRTVAGMVATQTTGAIRRMHDADWMHGASPTPRERAATVHTRIVAQNQRW
jgi:hypothetical protein